MSDFCLLREAKKYVAHDWDPLADPTIRPKWLEEFRGQFAETLKQAAVQYGRKGGKQVGAAQQQFDRALAAAIEAGRQANVMELYRLAAKSLRDNALADPYRHVTDREGRSASQIYPAFVRKLRALPNQQKWLQTVQCFLAAGSFHPGAAPAIGRDQADFAAAVENVKARPWLVDHFDPLASDLAAGPPSKWSKAVLFLAKAGADLVLGAMPLARELGLCGTKIVLAANESSGFADATADEAAVVVEQLAADDDDLASLIAAGMIEVVSTGNDLPVLDLSAVSDELNEAAQGAELVVLLGEGRAVQSNYEAAFTVDSLKLAALIDPISAARLAGAPLDCVCKYEPLPAAGAS